MAFSGKEKVSVNKPKPYTQRPFTNHSDAQPPNPMNRLDLSTQVKSQLQCNFSSFTFSTISGLDFLSERPDAREGVLTVTPGDLLKRKARSTGGLSFRVLCPGGLSLEAIIML